MDNRGAPLRVWKKDVAYATATGNLLALATTVVVGMCGTYVQSAPSSFWLLFLEVCDFSGAGATGQGPVCEVAHEYLQGTVRWAPERITYFYRASNSASATSDAKKEAIRNHVLLKLRSVLSYCQARNTHVYQKNCTK
mmetsp:Transcript_17452/g.34286  ORF Transcript_17452/g.34286 Transcript_17452/m.34286 type:complete len:138 (+) Transcript_17452:122-535(+)|eukprot:CAMPEP_0171566832 /NCGR_PEP_ID=MMETSP0961-20121227/803_1 /TAXON_ID=87120 /ORGANISM="Aurantiochytrium limacinum, Strain ATCCMYA-1381" /LENGTH=137 /DNA_ID=CAMNT_0012120645 /DNA_START=40 /DNA_END=453 /DNA_ORIENTATION=-